MHRRDALADQLGVDTKKLKVKELNNTIRELRKAHPDQRGLISELRAAARDEQAIRRDLVRSSEDLGMDASRDYLTSNGGDVIVGGERGAGKAGDLDSIGLREDTATGHQTLTVVEAKGGGSRLGFRKVDGVRVQQGSTVYLDDLLHRDPKLRSYLDSHPDLARELASGKVDVEYKLVRARESGTVGVAEFALDPSRLHLDDLAKTVGVPR